MTKKVLVISSNRLGDCILSSGLNNFFKNEFKDAKVFFVCGPIPGDFFKLCKNIDKIITLKKRKFSLHWLYLWKLTFFNYWDYIVDLRGTLISFFLFAKTRKIYSVRTNHHKVEEISTLFPGRNLSPNVCLNENNVKNKSFLKLTQKIALNKKLVIVAPSANWIGKTWPIQNFCSLLTKLCKNAHFKNSCFIIIGPKSEKKSIENLLKVKNVPIFDLVGKTDLAEIFLIMKKSKMFIGNDSGLMHLSALANIPTVGLFGPSDSKRYHPWGKKTLAIKGPKSPNELMGYKEFNPKKVNSLMRDLTVNYVFKELIKFYKTCYD
jgi:ADP-heptose:LPS heptosyltransferase